MTSPSTGRMSLPAGRPPRIITGLCWFPRVLGCLVRHVEATATETGAILWGRRSARGEVVVVGVSGPGQRADRSFAGFCNDGPAQRAYLEAVTSMAPGLKVVGLVHSHPGGAHYSRRDQATFRDVVSDPAWGLRTCTFPIFGRDRFGRVDALTVYCLEEGDSQIFEIPHRVHDIDDPLIASAAGVSPDWNNPRVMTGVLGRAQAGGLGERGPSPMFLVAFDPLILALLLERARTAQGAIGGLLMGRLLGRTLVIVHACGPGWDKAPDGSFLHPAGLGSLPGVLRGYIDSVTSLSPSIAPVGMWQWTGVDSDLVGTEPTVPSTLLEQPTHDSSPGVVCNLTPADGELGLALSVSIRAESTGERIELPCRLLDALDPLIDEAYGLDRDWQNRLPSPTRKRGGRDSKGLAVPPAIVQPSSRPHKRSSRSRAVLATASLLLAATLGVGTAAVMNELVSPPHTAPEAPSTTMGWKDADLAQEEAGLGASVPTCSAWPWPGDGLAWMTYRDLVHGYSVDIPVGWSLDLTVGNTLLVSAPLLGGESGASSPLVRIRWVPETSGAPPSSGPNSVLTATRVPLSGGALDFEFIGADEQNIDVFWQVVGRARALAPSG